MNMNLFFVGEVWTQNEVTCVVFKVRKMYVLCFTYDLGQYLKIVIKLRKCPMEHSKRNKLLQKRKGKPLNLRRLTCSVTQ